MSPVPAPHPRLPPRRAALWCLAAVALITGTPAHAQRDTRAAPLSLDTRLIEDPAIARATLANGLNIVVRPSPAPPGRATARLVINAGSLMEEDDQHGAAFLASRTLFVAALASPDGQRLASIPGSLDPTPDAGPRVLATAEYSWFTLSLPTANAPDLALGLSVFASMLSPEAGDALLDEGHRSQALAEAEQAETMSDRVRRPVAPFLAPETRYATHHSFPAFDALCEIPPRKAAEFVRSWYTPLNATLIVTGDADPGLVITLARRAFEGVPPRPTPRPDRLRVPQRLEMGAVVTQDQSAPATYAELIVPGEPLGPVRSAAALRRSLVEEVATRIVEQRLRALRQTGAGPVRESHAWVGDVSGPMRIASCSVAGDAADWQGLVSALLGSLANLARSGASKADVDLAATGLLTSLAEKASLEASTPSSAINLALTRAEVRGSPFLSAAQLAQTAPSLLDTLTPEEVSRVLAERFEPTGGVAVLVMPAKATPPAADEFAAVARQATDGAGREQPATAPALAAGSPLASLGDPGRVEELRTSPASSVTSARFANAARVHHKRTADAPAGVARASLTVTIAGGRIEEDADSRGLTLALGALLSEPSTHFRSGTAGALMLSTIGARLSHSIEDDRVVISASFPAEHAAEVLAFIAELLSAPAVDPAAIERWKWAQLKWLDLRDRSPLGALDALLHKAVLPPGDPRFGPLTSEDLDRIEAARVERWAVRLFSTGPIEAALVGDLDRAHAIDIFSHTIGALPARAPIGEQLFCERREAHRPPRQPLFTSTHTGDRPEAAALVAAPAPDATDIESVVNMDLASRVLAESLNHACCVARSLAQRIDIKLVPASAYHGSGLLVCWAVTQPHLAEHVLRLVESELDRLGARGPGADELARAKSDALADLDRALSDPASLASALAQLTYRGLKPDDLLRHRVLIESAGAGAVARTVARFDSPEDRLRLVTMPGRTPGE